MINALENERQARERAELAIDRLGGSDFDLGRIDHALTIAVADVGDAIEVLEGVALHPEARSELRRARNKLAAAKVGTQRERIAVLTEALTHLALARADMIDE